MKNKIDFKQYKHGLVLIAFVALYGLYFLSNNVGTPVWTVHCALDDRIPFVDWFIVFYFLWYLYISVPLVWLMIRSKNDFLRMSVLLLCGMVLCNIFFFICPTALDIRAEAEREVANKSGLIPLMCRFIYASDNARNVFPSLHCFESVAIHITLCHSETGRKHRAWLYPISLFTCVAICLSTVFIKQHSVLDAAAGIALALPLTAAVYISRWKFNK